MADRQPGGRRAAAAEGLGLALILATVLGSTAVVALAYKRARPIPVDPPPTVVLAPAPPPRAVVPPPTPVEDPTPGVVGAIEQERSEAEHAATEAEARAGAARGALRSKLAANEAIKRRAVLARSQLDALETKALALEERADEFARERDLLAAERDANRRELEAAKSRSGAASSFAIAPYKGANGTWRKPIVLDCRDGGATLLPDGPTFGVLELSGELGMRGNPLIATVVAAIAQARNERGPDGLPVIPYVMFLVRPDGIRPYYEARNLLERLGVAFGYELADQDWDVEVVQEGPSALASRSPGGSTPLTPGRTARRGVILEPPTERGGVGLRPGPGDVDAADGIRSLADHLGAARPGGSKGLASGRAGSGGQAGGAGSEPAGAAFPPGDNGLEAGDSTAVAVTDPSLQAFDRGELSSPEGRPAPRGGGPAGLAAESVPGSDRRGMPEFSPTPPSSALDSPGGATGLKPLGGPATEGLEGSSPGGPGGKPAPRSSSRTPGETSGGSGIETGLPAPPAGGTPPGEGSPKRLALPDGFTPTADPLPTGTWDRTSPPAPGGKPSSGAVDSEPSGPRDQTSPPTPGGGLPSGSGSQRPSKSKAKAGGSGVDAADDPSQGTPVPGSYAGKRPDRNLMLTVACGPNGVVVQPGNHKIGKVKLAGPGDPVLRRLRAIVDAQQAATPGVTVRPEVRFLVELGGEDSYMKARRQTILAGLGWPTSLRVAEGSPVKVGLGGTR